MLMSAYGDSAGIDFKFRGTMANSLPAHRVIQHFQSTRGPAVAGKIVDTLFSLYFEHEAHPSSPATLLQATSAAGIPDEDVKKVIEDENLGLKEVQDLISQQKGNGIDAVPYVRIEGKRRDLKFEGCQDVEDYIKGLETIVKESA